MRALYTFTIFLNSALLFLVQPMVAKYLLPRFGGAPLVWNVCLLFFQSALLLGYLYAHAANRKVSATAALAGQIGLLILGLLASSAFAGRMAVRTGLPALDLLSVLALTVGLVFIGLAAGSPSLQGLFHKTSDPRAHDPYFLYAASNAGSILALLAYPALIEPWLTLEQQASLFAGGVCLLILFLGACLVAARKDLAKQSSSPAPVGEGTEEIDTPLTWKDRLRWIALASAPSALLLGVTVYITTNVSPIPLLWIIPLALYLLTFIMAFAGRQLISPRRVMTLLPIVLFPALVALGADVNGPTLIIIPLHLLAFFFICLACHGRLSATRPHGRHLTEFYLLISTGGVIGGIFSALLAPVLFTSLAEYPIAIVAGLLFAGIWAAKTDLVKFRIRQETPERERSLEVLSRVWDVLWPLLIFSVVLVLRVREIDENNKYNWILAAFVALMFSAFRPVRSALVAGALLLALNLTSVTGGDKVLLAERSFYGSHRVVSSPQGVYHKLFHGTTLHGVQNTLYPQKPLTYYEPLSGIGRVFQTFGDMPRLDNVAFVGLGTGTLAAWGRKGQTITFYELDPSMERLARNPKLFTFLRDSEAQVKVAVGDARIRLQEAPDHCYGLVVLDAFTSDSIPIHLLTREAFHLYDRVLTRDGILVVHISNRYLDLEPVVANAAKEIGFWGLDGLHSPLKPEDSPLLDSMAVWLGGISGWNTEAGAQQLEILAWSNSEVGDTPSEWIVLAHSPLDLYPIEPGEFWKPIETRTGLRIWTDSYSNLLSVLKFR